ncbi:hypothetical protein BJ994_000357 [Arthrobacter pigmenti]|uniref:Uncharacterized protein n=1 Tax=Arthrobacter pigmenti TaxID=271432 RepID=A0A846RSJ3_9MICC|nr:hypothetical protein [Arthrobacter pigmenti]NJC21281.1 hypothetical protein [Arthrobacter pigmenti]
MGETSTPLAGAFFRMVLFGGFVGALVPVGMHIITTFGSAFPHILTVIAHSCIGFSIGLVVAGSAAGPAVGLHTLAATKAPKLCIPGAALGGAAGPVIGSSLLFGLPVPGFLSVLAWAFLLASAALTAIYFTKPLRSSNGRQATDRRPIG